jgi:hypothetical protein
MLMPEGELPEDGELRLGRVVLSGRRAYTQGLWGEGRLVAWVTDGRVPDAGRIWQELSDLAAETGLLPVLSALGAEGFAYHYDAAAVTGLDAGEILAWRWENKTAPDGDPDADAWIARLHQPFTRQFPGLAPPVGEQLTVPETRDALDTVPPQFVCLAAVSRPADFLTEVGWFTTEAWEPAAASVRGAALVGRQVRGPAPADRPAGQDPAPGRQAAADRGRGACRSR